MKCPNCNETFYENDKFCGNCGYDLSKLSTQSSDTYSEQSLNAEIGDQEIGHSDLSPTASSVTTQTSYVNEAFDFLKSAFVSPESTIKEKRIASPWISILVPIILLLSLSILTLIVIRSSADPYAYMEIGMSFIFQTFFYTALTFTLFYFVLFLMNKLIIKDSAPWDKVLNDYAVLSIVIIACYILSALLLWIKLYEISIISALIGGIIFYIAPIYIFLKYAENHKSKIDTFYSLFIYILLTAVAYYIIIRIIIIEIENTIAPYWFY